MQCVTVNLVRDRNLQFLHDNDIEYMFIYMWNLKYSELRVHGVGIWELVR